MKYRLGLAQMNPVLGDVKQNLEIHRHYLELARQDGVQVLVFPELSLSGYTLMDLVPEVAQTIDDSALSSLLEASRDLDIIVSFPEVDRDYRYYISAAYLSGGAVRHVHRKVYLPTYGMFDEKRYFAAGDNIRAFDTPYARTGMMVCEDMWHPALPNVLALDGAQVLICLSSGPGRGVSGDELGAGTNWDLFCRTYARLFQTYVVFTNRVGFEDGVNFFGGSRVVSPQGETVVLGKHFEEDWIVVDLDLERVRRARSTTPILRDERLELIQGELSRIMDQRRRGWQG